MTALCPWFQSCVKKHLCPIAFAAMLLCGCGNVPETPSARPATEERGGTSLPAATKSLDVVFLGDSVGRGTGDETGRGFNGILEKELEARGVDATGSVNLALDGARTRHVLEQLQRPRIRQRVAQAEVIVLSIGGNDLFIDSQGRRADVKQAQQMAERVIDRVGSVIDEIREVNASGRIFFLGLYNPFFDSSFAPVASAYVQHWNDRLAMEFNGKRGVTVIDTFDLLNGPDRLAFDRFHPSAKGYELISERIAERIAE